MKGFLLKLARAVLNQVIAEIGKQIMKLQQDVYEAAREFMSSRFDDMWKGEDAEEFQQELSNALKKLEQIIGLTGRVQKGLDDAANVVDGADKKVTGLVSDLNSTFGNIY